VTGGTGFIGSSLVRKLLDQNVEVAILLRSTSNTWRIEDILHKTEIIHGNLGMLDEICDQIKEFSPDFIYHLAWEGVGNQYRNDLSQINNIQSTLNLIKKSKEFGCQKFIGLGSQAEYGPKKEAITEESPTTPTTLYGETKLACGKISAKVADSIDLEFAWLRLFSSYGPKDDPQWMIPYVILQLNQGISPNLTAGEQRWDYLYITDVAEALWKVSISPDATGFFNLGSGQAPSLKTTIEKIRNKIDPNIPLKFGEIAYRPDQVMHLQADISRLQKLAYWNPVINLDDGLQQTIEWFTNPVNAHPSMKLKK
jgi:UDP-glucose 4-epimerase